MSQGVCVDFSTSIEEKTENYSVGKGGAYRAGGPDPEHPETKGCSDTRKLKIGYRRDLNTSYFIIESDRFYQADYQMKMLTNNQIPGLLLVKGRGVFFKQKTAYEIDTLCTFPFTAATYREMLATLCHVSSRKWAQNIRKNLPVLLIAGTADPVGDYGAGVRKVWAMLGDAGVQDLSCEIWHDARHELHNETNREEVFDYVYGWLMDRLPEDESQ